MASFYKIPFFEGSR